MQNVVKNLVLNDRHISVNSHFSFSKDFMRKCFELKKKNKNRKLPLSYPDILYSSTEMKIDSCIRYINALRLVKGLRNVGCANDFYGSYYVPNADIYYFCYL